MSILSVSLFNPAADKALIECAHLIKDVGFDPETGVTVITLKSSEAVSVFDIRIKQLGAPFQYIGNLQYGYTPITNS